MLVFDIETGPIPDEELQELFTFDESAIKGFDLLSKDFDPSEVKTGNIKDKAKIDEKIALAKEKFENEKTGAKVLVETSREAAWKTFKSKAALSPLTGQVLAVGIYCPDWHNQITIDYVTKEINEETLINGILEFFDDTISKSQKIIGHNILGFDFPFLLRRATKYGIKIPRSILVQLNTYKPSLLIDTMRLWQCGNRMEAFVKLDQLASFFGTTRKNGSGANFSETFFNNQIEALRYLENDILMTKEIWEKMEGLHV
jgi:hypothetical protein